MRHTPRPASFLRPLDGLRPVGAARFSARHRGEQVMREPVLVGNWKMNATLTEAHALAQGVREGCQGLDGIRIVLCPPFTALATVARALAGSGFLTGAQDVY